MARESIEARRLEIANELIDRALPLARSDRNFPAWVTRALSGDRRFGSRDRRYYRELIYAAVRFLPWVEGVAEVNRSRAALWLAGDTPETADSRTALTIDPRRGAACPRPIVQGDDRGRAQGTPLQARAADLSIAERAAAFNNIFESAAASPESLVPKWVASECPALLDPAELERVHTRAPLWLRVAGDPATAASALAADGIQIEPSERTPTAARVVSGPDVTRSRAYADGLVEVQDIGSQWVIHTASPSRGERWLDACAGAGGKTLQLASLVGVETPVVAHDIRESALAELKTRAARAGIGSIRVDPRPSGLFDAVLVDAPCSGSGTWRRSPHLKWQTTRADLTQAATKQIDLLDKFAGLVRPGGRLVYATCSIATTENLGVVRSFLAGRSGFRPETPGSDAQGTTLLPSQLDSDGFFVSVLRKCEI